MTDVQERTISSGDGTSLHVRDIGNANASKTLLLVHGYGEHGGRYVDAVEPFVAAGYRVLAPDLRGHGKSAGARGHIMTFENYLTDVDAVFGLVETPPSKSFIFGHSNGGLITLHWLLRNKSRVAAAAVTSPFLGLALQAPGWKIMGGKLLSRVLPKVSLPSEIEAKDVSQDPEVVAQYDSDPLIHHVVNARFFTEAMTAIDELFVKNAQIEVPVFIQQAGEDKIASAEATRRWAGGAPSSLVTYEEAEGQYHELFFDIGGDAYRDRVLEYFESQARS